MLVKNTGKKCIGFGSLILTPDAVGELPEGYSAEHPTVKFYIDKKWLEEVKEDSTAPITPPDENKSADAKIKSLNRLNLELLRNEADTLGIEWADDNTKAQIIAKITEKLSSE